MVILSSSSTSSFYFNFTCNSCISYTLLSSSWLRREMVSFSVIISSLKWSTCWLSVCICYYFCWFCNDFSASSTCELKSDAWKAAICCWCDSSISSIFFELPFCSSSRAYCRLITCLPLCSNLLERWKMRLGPSSMSYPWLVISLIFSLRSSISLAISAFLSLSSSF